MDIQEPALAKRQPAHELGQPALPGWHVGCRHQGLALHIEQRHAGDTGAVHIGLDLGLQEAWREPGILGGDRQKVAQVGRLDLPFLYPFLIIVSRQSPFLEGHHVDLEHRVLG